MYTNDQLIQEWLINNQSYLIELLSETILDYNILVKEQDVAFKQDIEDQFKKLAKTYICDEIANDLALPVSDILGYLETVDLIEYLIITEEDLDV
jgi:hypothetical protein